MFSSRFKSTRNLIFLSSLFLLLAVLPASAGLNDLLGKKELDETERKETIERIQSIQEKLQLLQDKLRVLERRKAAKNAAQTAAGSISATPVQINWQPVDETTTDPGEFGLYTYLLFKGEATDQLAIGTLEDLILTIETLQENDIPVTLANRFLIPVEKPQSLVHLGRQPYDFTLNEAYLRRLELQGDLPNGPVVVSLREPLDPYASGEVPAFLAVSFGRQNPQRALQLAQIWQHQEKDAIMSKDHPLSALFWQIINGAGPTKVSSDQKRILVSLPQ